MASFSWGSAGTSTTSFTDNYVYTGVGLPTGNPHEDGYTGCLITALEATNVRGRSGARTVYLSLSGIASTGGIGVASAGSANGGTGAQGASGLCNGGSTNFVIDVNPNGSIYFGRGGGGTTYDSYGTSWAGTLPGIGYYVQAPLVPQSLGLVQGASPGSVDLSWSAPSSDGESAITGYRVKYWRLDAPGVIYTSDLGVVTSTTISGLDRGYTWVFQVAAKNAVTTAAGRVGIYTSSASILLPAGGKVWDGAAFVNGVPKAWNGSAWVGANIRVWDGSAFVNAL